jgi:signal transduction histidine kinase
MENRVNGAVSVLYVEDDAATREMVARLLKRNGFDCIVAENGREGLELYRRHAPEIVLSDIMMSGMSGLEMARAIRTYSSEVLFIFMTASGESKFILEAIDIGVTHYVVKPVELHLLLAAISHCVAIIRLKSEAQRAKQLEAIGILAGGLAHDFNNLLQVVMGYVSLAKKGIQTDSTVYAYLDQAEVKSREARELGKRLRTLSRGESTLRQKMPLTPLILCSVKAALHGTSINPAFDLPPDMPQLYFDKAQIRQVIAILSLNAIEAMPHGGNLEVAARVSRLSRESNPLLPPGDYVHITFSDTGKGILPENLPKIFYPYFSTKEMDFHKGQGLSLSVCHSIISRHGGLINANNSSDSGAIFNIWLPVADETIL